jgi:hypothetical protein
LTERAREHACVAGAGGGGTTDPTTPGEGGREAVDSCCYRCDTSGSWRIRGTPRSQGLGAFLFACTCRYRPEVRAARRSTTT